MDFVTGGTGILGSQLIYDLVSTGSKVRALKRKGSNLSPIKKIFSRNKQSELFEKIEWVEGDVNNIGCLIEHFSSIDRVFHCAAIVSFNPRDKTKMETTNISGTANVVDAGIIQNVNELIYVSSTAAIGTQKKAKTITEKDNWDAGIPNSFYSLTKYFAELEVWRGAEEGLKVSIVNPGIIIGPGEWGKSSTNVFKTAWKGLKFYSSGTNAFVDVRDVSRAMLLLSEKKIFNERFLLIAENKSFKFFFDTIAKSLNKKAPSILATKLMSSCAWRLNWIWSKLTGANPLITKETARAANSISVYSNQKIIDKLGFKFTPIEESIKYTGGLFLKDVTRHSN
ncbi:MAG: NAD-dependent epimerase/dehydratase family protein [Salibacteraceae bacterium]